MLNLRDCLRRSDQGEDRLEFCNRAVDYQNSIADMHEIESCKHKIEFDLVYLGHRIQFLMRMKVIVKSDRSRSKANIQLSISEGVEDIFLQLQNQAVKEAYLNMIHLVILVSPFFDEESKGRQMLQYKGKNQSLDKVKCRLYCYRFIRNYPIKLKESTLMRALSLTNLPPEVNARFTVGDLVDAFHNDGWWPGRYIWRDGEKYKVTFDNMDPPNETLSYTKRNIRFHHECSAITNRANETANCWLLLKR
ncbi:hypothetical protein LXL04_034093 [Taraxacum kok-saghyz]